MDIPVYEKPNLTIKEASEYFSIGQNKLRDITADARCDFVLYVGTKRLIKRQAFENWLAKQTEI